MASLLPRPGRCTAVAGAVLAIAAATAMALGAGTAAAGVPGHCIPDVVVRSAPDADAEVVGSCAVGTAVRVTGTRDGVVPDPGGWAGARHVVVGGTPPAGPAPAPAQKPAPTPAAEDDAGRG